MNGRSFAPPENLFERCASSSLHNLDIIACAVLALLATPMLFLILLVAWAITRLSWLRRCCPVVATVDEATVTREQLMERALLMAIQQLPRKICDEPLTGQECSLCMEAFSCGQELRQLHCGHTFHLVCVDRWLLYGQRHHARRCPLCRALATPVYEGATLGCRDSEGPVPSCVLDTSPRRRIDAEPDLFAWSRWSPGALPETSESPRALL